MYTSRPPREGEKHGVDYYFLSRSAVEALPEKDFLVGSVRTMKQAVDLAQLETDLKSNRAVMIEIYHNLWPELVRRMQRRLNNQLRVSSVFLTAVDPERVLSLPRESRAEYIRSEVTKILNWRGKDAQSDIALRSEDAVKEILEAIEPSGPSEYDAIIHSAPEGPDNQDDWTREGKPVGLAKQATEKFIAHIINLES
jgi:guanylate kinase